MRNPFLFVALDRLNKDEKETLKVTRRLSTVDNSDFGFKVNLDYLLLNKGGLIRGVSRVQEFGGGRPIFTDLKMFNGSRTMGDVVEELVDLEVDFLNVHALADELIKKAITSAKGTKTKILAVTVMTHYDDKYCRKHFKRSLTEMVRHLSRTAIDQGCHGVILPGTTLDFVSDIETTKVVPGVRPKWYKDTRHKEEIEPHVAKQKKADIIVCGSPIMKSPKPTKALELILSEIR